MTDDLVKRLREYGDWPQDVLYREWSEWSHKAADRIEALEAALRQICDKSRDADQSYAELFADVCWEARAALGEKKDD